MKHKPVKTQMQQRFLTAKHKITKEVKIFLEYLKQRGKKRDRCAHKSRSVHLTKHRTKPVISIAAVKYYNRYQIADSFVVHVYVNVS